MMLLQSDTNQSNLPDVQHFVRKAPSPWQQGCGHTKQFD